MFKVFSFFVVKKLRILETGVWYSTGVLRDEDFRKLTALFFSDIICSSDEGSVPKSKIP